METVRDIEAIDAQSAEEGELQGSEVSDGVFDPAAV
jgi:hypothetical protein